MNKWCLGYKVRYTGSQLSQASQPWSLILLWNKSKILPPHGEIRKLVFIEELWHKPFMSIKSVLLAIFLFYVWRNWVLESLTTWLISRRARIQTQVLLCCSQIQGYWHTCLPVIFSPCPAEPPAPQSPRMRHWDQLSSSTGDQEHRRPASSDQSHSHWLYFTCGTSWFHPTSSWGNKKKLKTTVRDHATS